MTVEAQVTINGSRAAVWAAITNIENAAEIISGVEKIEIVEKPASGLVGMTWRETRMLFGKTATVEKVIVAAAENKFYTTEARDGGFLFTTYHRIADHEGPLILRSIHETKPQGFIAWLKAIPMTFFKGVIKKAVLQDLNDIKAAVERGGSNFMKAEFRVLKARPTLSVVLTRDSVCAGDDSDAPHEKKMIVHSFVDPEAFVKAVSANYLPSVAGIGHSWSCVLNDVCVAEISVSNIRTLVRESPFSEDNRMHFVHHSATY